MSADYRLYLRNANQIIQISNTKETIKRGKTSMNDIALLSNASVIVGLDGKENYYRKGNM